MNHLNIKPVRTSDVPDLQRVLSETDLFPPEALPPMLAPVFSGQSQELWLAGHIEGHAVALCYVAPEEMTEGTWNMRALAVLPSMQGKSIGSRLVAAAEDRLRQDKQRLLIVDTSSVDEFEQARRFYLANGYRKEASIQNFWSEGDHKITFCKSL